MTQAHTLWLIFVVALIVRLTYTLGLYLGMGNDALQYIRCHTPISIGG